tara:strand:- start:693 stop:1007 length:315 start_codon:yes stop_codon:yes gene_type:complete
MVGGAAARNVTDLGLDYLHFARGAGIKISEKAEAICSDPKNSRGGRDEPTRRTAPENYSAALAPNRPRDNKFASKYPTSKSKECYNCKEAGHFANVCPKPKKKE